MCPYRYAYICRYVLEVIPYDNIHSNIDLHSFVQGLKENAHSIKLYKIIFYITQ